MKKFTFRLERILHYKAEIEDQKRRDLSRLIDELTIQQNGLLRLTAERESYLKKYSSLFKGKVDVEGLKTTRRFLDKLHRDLVAQAKKVIECERQVARAKADLLEAMRDRKKYENLREHKLKAYIKDSDRQEQKRLDEFGNQAALRRSRAAAAIS